MAVNVVSTHFWFCCTVTISYYNHAIPNLIDPLQQAQ